jgi:hypothetical protein
MHTSRPQIAFLAAALVLLVLPVLVMLGLSALGMAMHLGMTTFEDMRERQAQEAEQLIRQAGARSGRPDCPSRQRFAWAIHEQSLWTLPMNGKQT